LFSDPFRTAFLKLVNSPMDLIFFIYPGLLTL
jgi:hypothetical protein